MRHALHPELQTAITKALARSLETAPTDATTDYLVAEVFDLVAADVDSVVSQTLHDQQTDEFHELVDTLAGDLGSRDGAEQMAIELQEAAWDGRRLDLACAAWSDVEVVVIQALCAGGAAGRR